MKPFSCMLMFLAIVVPSIFLGSSSADLAGDLGAICSVVSCGQGSCKASQKSILGFECDCYPDWTKFQLGLIVFPVCNIPKCTTDTGCNSNKPSPPSLPTLPSFNLSDPCTMAWCGDGKCAASGISGYVCNCNTGSDNFRSSKSLPCFRTCALGRDCEGIKLGPSTAPSTPNSNPLTAPAPASDGSNKAGRGGMEAVLASATLLISCFLL